MWAASQQKQQNDWAPSEDSDQPGHLIWSDWADAKADLSLRWAHMRFCWFCHEVALLFNLTEVEKYVFLSFWLIVVKNDLKLSQVNSVW